MSNQTERRVEDLLSRSKLSTNDSASSSNVSMRQSLPSTSSSVVEQPADIDKEKLSSQLRNLQNSRKMTPSARSMQSFREKLPAFNMREGFLKAVAANQASLFYFLVHPLHVLYGKCMVYSLSSKYLPRYAQLFSFAITCFSFVQKAIL